MSKIQQQWKELPTPAKIGIYAVGAFFLYKIVKNIKNRPTIAPLPTGGSGIPAVGYDQSGSPVPWNPKPLADELFAAFDGLFTPLHIKSAAVVKLLNLPTPDMLTAVYNTFNQLHGDGDTLTEWIRSETPFPGQSDAIAKLTSINLQ